MEYIQISGIQTMITNLRQEILFYKFLPKQNQNVNAGEDSKPVVRRTKEDILGVTKPMKMPLFGSNLQNLFILYLGMVGGSIVGFFGENRKSPQEVCLVNAKIIWIGLNKILQFFLQFLDGILCSLLHIRSTQVQKVTI